jgi:hypothetical protein
MSASPAEAGNIGIDGPLGWLVASVYAQPQKGRD